MRSLAEQIARGLALAATLGLLWLALRIVARPRERADAAALPALLARWSTASDPAAVHARLDAPLAPAHAAWLLALPHAGTAVSWDAPGTQPIAAVADPVADPAGGTRVLVSAANGNDVTLEDSWGPLDSVRADAAGARFLAGSAPRNVTVRSGAMSAHAAVTDTLTLGRVLVLGTTGWESKFVAAALEERGWRVDLDFALSPRGDVVQGRTSPLDIGTHAAVIVLDTAAAPRASAVARFVAQGGGLVMAAPALESGVLASLAAGAGVPAARLPAIEPFDSAFADPRRSLALTTLRPRADAVSLEQRGPQVAVVARRAGRGRVAVVGYDDTWRWRLAGAGEAPEAHRAWWAGLVAAVAHASNAPRSATGPLNEAPYARLVDRLGQPSAPPPVSRPARALEPWLFGLLLAGFLYEWASRRLRGMP